MPAYLNGKPVQYVPNGGSFDPLPLTEDRTIRGMAGSARREPAIPRCAKCGHEVSDFQLYWPHGSDHGYRLCVICHGEKEEKILDAASLELFARGVRLVCFAA
jgi:hypothetical protein